MFLKAILIGGVLPGFLAAVFLGALWWRRRGDGPGAAGPRWAMPVVIALAIFPAELLVRAALPALWPVAAADRIPHVALVLMVLGIVESVAGGGLWAAFALRALGAGAAFWITLGVRIPAFWNPWQGALWIGGFALLTAAVATLLERIARADRSPAVTVTLLLSAGALPIVLLESGNAYLAQLAGGVAAALGAAMVVSVFIRPFTIASGGISAGVTLLAALLLCGHYYAPDGIPLVQTILVALTPLAVLMTLVPSYARMDRRKRCVIAFLWAVLPAALAVGLARSGAEKVADEYSDGM